MLGSRGNPKARNQFAVIGHLQLPFVNANGRTTRMHVNCLAMRYGLATTMDVLVTTGLSHD
jgi:hypothetical protein